MELPCLSLSLVVIACLSAVACGGSSTPPPTDPSGASVSGSTTPESGTAPADSSAPGEPESPPGADTPAANTK